MGQPVTARLHSIPAGVPLPLANPTLEDVEQLSIADSDAGTLKQVHLLEDDCPPEYDRPRPRDPRAGWRRWKQPSSLREQQLARVATHVLACAGLFVQRADDEIASLIILFATGDEGADVDAPNLKMQIPSGQTLAAAFNKGVKVLLRSGEPCALDLKLLISRRLASRLDIPRLVGSAHRTLVRAGQRSVATDFTRKAKRARGACTPLAHRPDEGDRRNGQREDGLEVRHAPALRYPRRSRGA
jgi:hypothetical protein